MKENTKYLMRLYRTGVSTGIYPDIQKLIESDLERKKLSNIIGYSGYHEKDVEDIIDNLLRNIAKIKTVKNVKKGIVMEDNKKNEKLVELGLEFLTAARRGDLKKFQKFIKNGFPIDFQHPEQATSAWHEAGGTGAENIIDFLIDTKQCDYLLKDKFKRYGSIHPRLMGNLALAEKMSNVERSVFKGEDYYDEVIRQSTQWFDYRARQIKFHDLK